MGFRKEKDSLGVMEVPEKALYGASTQRAVLNFPISDLRFPFEFLQVFAWIKEGCAETNAQLKLLDSKIAKAIREAAQEIAAGKYHDQFVVDIFQTGSGTSTNMNFNEVIAHLASRKLKTKVHPNDHVNLGQSSNDIFPTVLHVAAVIEIEKKLLPNLRELEKSLLQKARSFSSVVKVGRTHLQDATPLLLGQEFSAYATQIKKGIQRIENALAALQELPVGGTAVGTGINTHLQFGRKVSDWISKKTGLDFIEAKNHFEAQACRDGCVEMSGALKTLAISLMKIANDLRWLSCGPRAGIGELKLPEVQPGSSIMPGKVNPVIPEAVLQISAKVIGNDSTLTWAGASGNFELNTMMPLLAHSLLESINILANGVKVLDEKCVRGIKADTERIEVLLKNNLMLATPLALKVGYEKAAEVAQWAFEKKCSIQEAARKLLKLSEKEIKEILDPKNMIRPQK